MKAPSCVPPFHALIVILAVGLPSVAAAQTPRRPAVDVRQLPTAVGSVLAADFNRDGRPDLISDHSEDSRVFPSPVVVRLGRGDGTFGAPRPIGVNGIPVVTGDFNGDGRQDVVVLGRRGALWMVPGHGNGTFDAGRALAPADDFRFALSADLTGDGIRDLVIGYGAVVEVRPGRGDFRFDPAMTLPPGDDSGSSAAVVADFDGNGRPDIAVGQISGSVLVYLNHGALLFGVMEIPITDHEFQGIAEEVHGLASGDLNGDGHVDLVVPHAADADFQYGRGGVDVLLGVGNGTFAPAVTYRTSVLGPRTAAIGDFNRDGVLDVAIGARSPIFFDEDAGLSYWDSVSIFPGRGDGTLAAPAAFRLDTAASEEVRTYAGAHATLRALDLNGDGHADLLATPGAIILNRALAANRPPTIDAGPDRIAFRCTTVAVRPAIAEPDWDWLSVVWRDETGAAVARSPTLLVGPGLVTGDDGGCETHTYTVTVTDARGASASDTVTVTRIDDRSVAEIQVTHPAAGWRFASGAAAPIRWNFAAAMDRNAIYRVLASADGFQSWKTVYEERATGQLEAVWSNAGPPGTTWRVRVDVLYDEGNRDPETAERIRASGMSAPFTIDPAAGAGLPWPWESRDIGFVGAPGSATHADGTFTVRGSGSDIWGTADGFHFLYQRVQGDVAFEGRVATVQGAHPWTKAGLMIRQSLSANSVHHYLLGSGANGLAYQRRLAPGGESLHTSLGAGSSGVTFRIVRRGGVVLLDVKRDGDTTFATVAQQPFPEGPAYIGLAVTSHDFARLATSTFDQVQVRNGARNGWSSHDVGTVAARGGATYDAATGTFRVRGSGADIWGTADAFHFVSHEVRRGIEDAFEVTARVRAVQNVHPWTKAGLMIRSGRGASAAHASIFVTPTPVKGVAFQRRRADGSASVHTAGPAITAPVWLKLVQASNWVSAYYRHRTTDPWTFLGADGIHFSPLEDEGRTARTNYEVGLAVTSHMDGVVAEAVFDHVSIRPIEFFSTEDVGATGVPGTNGSDMVIRTIAGSGADIWGTADAFRYQFADVSMRSAISARVLRIEPTHVWAKAGVMIREDLSPGSRHVMLIVSPGRGVAMQYRGTVNGPSDNIALVPGAAPAWVRLTRDGASIRGEISQDGLAWREVGRITLPLTEYVTAGLAVTSHDNRRLAAAVFDDVILER